MNAHDLDTSQETLRSLIFNIKDRWDDCQSNRPTEVDNKVADTLKNLLIDVEEWDWKRKRPKEYYED